MVIARALPEPEAAPVAHRSPVASIMVAMAVLAAVLAFDPAGLRPFTVIRWPLVAASVLGAAALLWRWRPRLPLLVAVPGLGLLGWMLLATLAADDGLVPWLGHPQRHLGLLAWVVAAAGLVVGTALDGPARRSLGVAACLGAAALGIGALVEVVGVDLAGAAFPGLRAGGTLGQPAHLGALGVLLVPVAVGVALEARDRWRAAAWVGAGLGTIAVALSQTRGAWVGLVVAGVVLAGVLRRRWPGAPLLGAAVLFAVAVAVAASPLGARALSSFDLDGGSARGRVDEWQVASRVVADHPVLGVGPEGYRLVATAYIDEDYSERYGRAVVVDRAHNGVLDVALAGGVPAAALYVVLVGAIAHRVWRRRADLTPFAAAAAAAAAGYAVQQLVLFPVAEIDPLAWMLAGVALAATLADPSMRSPRPRGVVVPAGLALLAVGTLVVGGLDVVADRHLAAAQRALADGSAATALTEADAATVLRPDSIDGWYVAARTAAAGPSLVDVDVALDRVGSGLDRSPRDPALLDLEERLLVERALRSGLDADRAEALAALERRIAEDPANPAHRSLLAELRGEAGR